ncbi:MAG: archaellin/type IV pilin N-terminal domain-containing protein [Nanoarchaeota archaeon]
MRKKGFFEKKGFLDKKGISPLIASVLLIGFVVAVGATVIFWGRGFIKEKAAKEGALAQKQLECENVLWEVKDINRNSRIISIENKGNNKIDGFIMRVVEGGEGAEKINQRVDPLSQDSVVYPFSLARKAKIDIIPSLRPEGAGAPLVPCSGKNKVVIVE